MANNLKKRQSKIKTIYTKWVAIKLIQAGNSPICTYLNPKDNRLTVWEFERTDKFQSDFDRILKEGRDYE